jgi:hypothetical protein
MAMFFSGFRVLPTSINRYRRLLARAGASRVLWSTLNYECLLEDSAARAGLRLGYFAEPDDSPEVAAIWKLHGSCNFKVAGLIVTEGVVYDSGIVFDADVEGINPAKVVSEFSRGTSLYPVMALYAEGKPIDMSPSPIRDAQMRWREHISRAESIVVLGVRPNPEDAHIWGPLSTSPGVLCYVGAHREFEQWCANYRSGLPTRYLGSSWVNAEEQVYRALGVDHQAA